MHVRKRKKEEKKSASSIRYPKKRRERVDFARRAKRVNKVKKGGKKSSSCPEGEGAVLFSRKGPKITRERKGLFPPRKRKSVSRLSAAQEKGGS